MSEINHEEKHFFIPRVQLAELKREIDILLAKQKNGRLRRREQIRLEKLQGMTRRDFMKRSGAFILGTGVVGGIGYGLFRTCEAPETKPTRESTKERVQSVGESSPEKAEKVELVAGVKSMIIDYNTWLENLKPEQIENVDGIQKFVEIYNKKIKYLKTDAPIPELSLTEFDKSGNPDVFFNQLKLITELLKKEGYYFRATPTLGNWKGEEISYMATLLGEIKSQEMKHITRRGQTADYEHIVIGVPRPGESPDDYESAPSGFTAITYKTGEKNVVVQDEGSYLVSAEFLYSKLNEPVETEKDIAIQGAFGRYRQNSKAEGVKTIQKLLMATSLMHEEQHVLDGGLEEQVMNEKTLPKHMIIEMRGLLIPLTGKDPKVGLENLFNWNISHDELRQIIGKMTLGVIRDVAMREPITLFSVSDEEINQLGGKAMQLSDIFYKPVIQDNKPLDKTLQTEYERFLDKIKEK